MAAYSKPVNAARPLASDWRNGGYRGLTRISAQLVGVGGAGGVAGGEGGEGFGEGLGDDDEGDVEVDVEVDGAGEGVGVERFDDVGEALFDGHPPCIALDEFFRAGGVVVGDDDGGGFAAESGHDELPDGAGVVGQ